jgi:formylmethanofuran dehydrogenase subunit E
MRWFVAIFAIVAAAVASAQTIPSSPDKAAVEECLAKVREYHGAAGPWAVAGYRIGQQAMRELGLPRHAFSMLVVHRCPAKVQFTCMADGLQAATGTSLGKMNLRVEEVDVERMLTVIQDRKTGRCLTFTLLPALVFRQK